MHELRTLRRGQGSREEADFLLASASASGDRIRRLSLLSRMICVATITAIVVTHRSSPTLPDLLLIVPWLGLLATWIEIDGRLGDAWDDRPGLRGWLGRHLWHSRKFAMPSIPGVLENVGATISMLVLVIGPWAPDLARDTWHTAVVIVAMYAGLTLTQIYTDLGFYTCDPGQRPAEWLLIARAALPVVEAIIGAGLVWWLADDPSPWLLAALVLFLHAALVYGLVYDVQHAGAIRSYNEVREQHLRGTRELVSAEAHRVKTGIKGLAQSIREPEQQRSLMRLEACIDELRGRLEGDVRPTSVDRNVAICLEALRDTFPDLPTVSVACSDGSLLLSVDGSEVLRHSILDLMANSIEAEATAIDLAVDVDLARSPAVRVTVTVIDDGPQVVSSEQLNDFEPHSSRAVLARLCRQRRGDLTYVRVDQRTVATATYRSALSGEV